MKRHLFSAIYFFLFNSIFAQEWVQKMQDPNANFYEVQAAFESYWATHDRTEKGKGYKAYKRWENFVERRVYPSGNLSLLNETPKNYAAFIEKYNLEHSNGKGLGGGNNLIASATWTPIGPMGAISGNAGGQLLKSGRINFITVDPNNSSNLWIGAPAGGLWKSTNGGTSWTTNTDLLTVIGCSDLVIDPTNSNVMYLATGDGDAGDTRSIGVLKSTNGGATWASTGLSNVVTNYFLIRRLIINPANTQILLAATSGGIYRTTNGGANWTQVSNVAMYDLEFQSGNPNVVFAAGADFRISTNGGVSFTQVTNGIPITGVNRMAIAVTAADPNYVYVLASSSTNSGLQGFYRSTNGGTAFSLISTTVNLLGYATLGNDTGGQGWYDLCIAASPLNKDEVVTGGVNVWRTTNSGASWSIYGHWTGTGAPFTHADQHDLEFDANGTLFNTNDGTAYKRTGNTWTEISGNINISQIYRIGMSSLTANKWITGHQDNGTSIWNGTTYNAALGGDGMDCFFDRTNDANIFGEYQNGALRKSTNGGGTWNTCTTGLTGTAPWVTVWKQDPQTNTTLYCGYTEMFRSTNSGNNWTALTAIGGTGGIREFAVAPSSNQVIYALKSSGIYKTTNGGVSWTNVTGVVPVAQGIPEYICVDPTDPNNAWVVLSGYSNGNKVFVTTNGGAGWTNYSSNLPNLPVNCIVYQPGTSDMVYIGMDVGIYYRDSNSGTWTLYNTGLPNAPIAELEISPASPTLLHAATYGRGVWVASLYSAAAAPISSFSITGGRCAGAPVTFSDQSSNSPSTWSWSVSPNGGVNIAAPNGSVTAITFSTAGVYSVSVQASNVVGPGNVSTQTISINPIPVIIIPNSSQTICLGGVVSYTASGAVFYSWSNAGGFQPTVAFSPTTATIYSLTGTSNGCSSSATAAAIISAPPTLTISGANFICEGGSAVLLVSGATSYTWDNNTVSPFITVSPTITTSYSVSATSQFNGCYSSALTTITVNPLPQVTVFSADTLICSGQSAGLFGDGADTYVWTPGNTTGLVGIFAPNVTTTYTVTGTDANGCSNSATLTVRVVICDGISGSTVLKTEHYKVFPNPAKNKITIVHAYDNLPAVHLSVFDAAGRLVLEQQLHFTGNEKHSEVNLNNLAPGTYSLKLQGSRGKIETIKLIKE